MTLEQFAYFGEILAALGVVASLIYVARQLGQNTAMMRVAAASEGVERDYEIVAPIIQSRDLAEVWMKGETEFSNLDPADQTRLMFFERRAIVLWHHRFQLRQQSLMPDASWHEQAWIIQNIGRRESVREAWRTFREGFEPAFQEFVDGHFAVADRADVTKGAGG
jgi:hypothetical protein